MVIGGYRWGAAQWRCGAAAAADDVLLRVVWSSNIFTGGLVGVGGSLPTTHNAVILRGCTYCAWHSLAICSPTPRGWQVGGLLMEGARFDVSGNCSGGLWLALWLWWSSSFGPGQSGVRSAQYAHLTMRQFFVTRPTCWCCRHGCHATWLWWAASVCTCTCTCCVHRQPHSLVICPEFWVGHAAPTALLIAARAGALAACVSCAARCCCCCCCCCSHRWFVCWCAGSLSRWLAGMEAQDCPSWCLVAAVRTRAAWSRGRRAHVSVCRPAAMPGAVLSVFA